MMNFYDAYLVLSKVYSFGAYLKQAIKETPIEKLNFQKTIKIVYGVLDKDIELDYYITVLCDKNPKQKIKILLKIGFYAVKYLGNKPFAVTDSLVELSKKLGKGANAGFINAVMRKFSQGEIPLPTEKIKYLSVKYSYPEFAVKRLLADYPDIAEDIMAFDEETTFVRFPDNIDGETYLKTHGYEFSPTPFFNLFSAKGVKIDQDFNDGVFTFQSIGSVAICDLIPGGKTLLDSCSAPGGKSVLLSTKFESVTANELHPHRAELIKAYISRMHVENVTVTVGDASVFNGDLGTFSTVLCDVPCSGYGTLKTNPDIKLNKTDEAIKQLNKAQLSILKNCSKYVEFGGLLVYSTCSFFDDENDVIISKFLETTEDFEPVYETSKLPSLRKKYGLQFLPNISFGAGFYVSLLKKKS